MLVAALLLFWGWAFHFLSCACFSLVAIYAGVVQGLAVRPFTRRARRSQVAKLQLAPAPAPRLAPRQLPEQRGGALAAAMTPRLTPRQLQEQQEAATAAAAAAPRGKVPDHVQAWVHSSKFGAPRSSISCLSVPGVPTPDAVSVCAATARPATAVAAAAAALALFAGAAGVPAESTAAAVGAAAALAHTLTGGEQTSDTDKSRRVSSCCAVPPLEYEVSEAEQAELDDCAPSEFMCPLGRVLMTDPVCSPSGFTYQRSCIEEFIERTGHEPARGMPLCSSALYPNISMRDQIASWLQKQGIAT